MNSVVSVELSLEYPRIYPHESDVNPFRAARFAPRRARQAARKSRLPPSLVQCRCCSSGFYFPPGLRPRHAARRSTCGSERPDSSAAAHSREASGAPCETYKLINGSESAGDSETLNSSARPDDGKLRDARTGVVQQITIPRFPASIRVRTLSLL